MNDKLAIDEDVHELKFGRSFDADGTLSFHSMYFDFKPASIDTAQAAVIDIEQGNKVKVTVPHIEGSSTKQTVYCGSKQPSQKDFALIVNHKTGEFVLERLTCKLNLKRTRSEKAREIKPSITKHQKSAAETDKQTDVASASIASTKVKQEEPVKASKNKKLKSPAAQSSTGKKASSKSVAKRALSASSSSDASSTTSDDHDAQSSAASESEDEKPQSGSATRATQPSKSSSTTNFNICDDLQLSESDSSSESD